MASGQHRIPCKSCPFSRKCPSGELGGSPPEVYIGQIRGPFFLPCHSTHDYHDIAARRDPGNAQCAGAAIFRSNVGVADLMPTDIMYLPRDTGLIFSSYAEFLAFHSGCTIEEAKAFLNMVPPKELLKIQSMRSGTQRCDVVPDVIE